MTDVIAFTGHKGSGKDTAAAVLIAEGYTHVKMADGLKAMLRTLMRYQGADSREVERRIEGDLKEQPCKWFAGKSARDAMVTLGTEWGRDLISTELWVGVTEARCRLLDSVVISDVRFPNEVEMVHRLGGRVIRIDRNPADKRIDLSHPSENQIANLAVDKVLTNNFGFPGAFQAHVREAILGVVRAA